MKMGSYPKIRKNQNGSILIGLVVIMMIFAALGAAMMSMSKTATFSQIWTSGSSQAYFLAESGFRYTETEYKNTSDSDGDGEKRDDRNQKLISWNSPDPPASPVLFTLSDNTEKFEFKIFPYFLVTATAHSAGTTSLQAKFPGRQPLSITIPASPGKLKIGTDPVHTYTGYSYNPGTGIYTFTLRSRLLSGISDNMDVYMIANPVSGGSITKDGNLTLSDASFFPLYNGIFSIDKYDPLYNGVLYGYKLKNGNILEKVFDANNPSRQFSSITVGSSTNLVLKPFFNLNSIGIVDYGGDVVTKREAVYHIPISTSEKMEFVEKDWGTLDATQNFPHWYDSSKGTHKVKLLGGDKALQVTGTTDTGSDKESRIELNWSSTNVNLSQAHSKYGKYLSYDVQVKTGFSPSVPAYYMPGISFRLSSNGNYGVSFLKGNNSANPDDGIPNDLVPYNNLPMIILWQQTNLPSIQRKWLAYKHLTGRPLYFFDDMENGTLKWPTTDTWAQINTDSHSPTHCWTDSPGGNYPNNVDTKLTSQSIDLSTASAVTLTFWHHYDIFPFLGSIFGIPIGDRANVEISKDGGINWEILMSFSGLNQNIWKPEAKDLPDDYMGESNVKIRFRLITDNDFWAITSQRDGWYIDDVKIYKDFPINEATIMARVIEGATLKFTNGNLTPIKDGDLVVQGTARGTVMGDPVLESGSWGSNAAGILVLNNVSGTFLSGQDLYVNGSVLAKTSSDPDFFRNKDNYIKAYYGDTTGYGTPSANLLDYDKHGNPRGGVLRWPPDNRAKWSEDNDYFTLVQWDEVNSSVASASSVISRYEPDAIIRSNELTTTSGTFADIEIGLHTFGVYSSNIYFDDFGLQAPVSNPGFLPPVQE